MIYSNPLWRQAWRGLLHPGRAHLAYLNYLFIQAAVLFVWWPKNDLFTILEEERGPTTLMAVALAVGVSVSYYALRAGAEELLLPGQNPLREWALATRLRMGRIIGGYLAGHLAQVMQVVALSTPLVLAAYSVSGGEWPVLARLSATLFLQATVFRLIGAVVYLAIGHYATITLVLIRLLFAAGFIVPWVFFPAASYVVLVFRLFGAFQSPSSPGPADPSALNFFGFVLFYILLCMALSAVLARLLLRQRTITAVVAGEPDPAPGAAGN